MVIVGQTDGIREGAVGEEKIGDILTGAIVHCEESMEDLRIILSNFEAAAEKTCAALRDVGVAAFEAGVTLRKMALELESESNGNSEKN